MLLHDLFYEEFPCLLIFSAAGREFFVDSAIILQINRLFEFLVSCCKRKNLDFHPDIPPLFYLSDFNTVLGFPPVKEIQNEKIIFVRLDNDNLAIQVENIVEFFVTDKEFFREAKFLRITTHNYVKGKIVFNERELYLPDYRKIIADHWVNFYKRIQRINDSRFGSRTDIFNFDAYSTSDIG